MASCPKAWCSSVETRQGRTTLAKHLFITLAVLVLSPWRPSAARADSGRQPVNTNRPPGAAAIDPARSSPLEPGPDVPTAPGVTTILMHYYGAKGRPILWLRVPDQYVRTRSGAIVNNIGFFFMASYPDLKGSLAPGNEDLFGCVGYCRGRMLIELMNRAGSPSDPGRTLDLMLRFKTCADVQSPMPKAFNEVKECDGPKGYPQMVEQYYVQRGQNGDVNGYVICRPNMPVATCEQWTRLPKHKDVEVHYTFGMRDLEGWPAVHDAVASLVDGFVVKTLPPQSN